MTTFGERLAAQRAKTVPFKDVEVTLDDKTVEKFRFRRIPGRDWATIVAKNPMRLDSPIDAQYGYNYQGVCEQVALASGFHLEARGKEVPLSAEEWADLFETLSGRMYISIVDVIWELNEWGPQQRLASLKKASARTAASVKR